MYSGSNQKRDPTNSITRLAGDPYACIFRFSVSDFETLKQAQTLSSMPNTRKMNSLSISLEAKKNATKHDGFLLIMTERILWSTYFLALSHYKSDSVVPCVPRVGFPIYSWGKRAPSSPSTKKIVDLCKYEKKGFFGRCLGWLVLCYVSVCRKIRGESICTH